MYIFDGKILKLKIEENYEIVEHPGASACLIIHKDQILLVKQYRKALREYTWEIPAGKIDKSDKDPLITVLREVEEETGIKINKDQLIYLGKVYTTPGFSNEVIHIFFFLLQENYDKLNPLNPQEINTIKFFSKEELFKMISENEIKDSKTLSSITMAISRNLL